MNMVSKRALQFCYLIMFLTAFFYYPKWNKAQTEATISWDVSGYYMYLPALFIYNDIKHCSFKDSIIAKYYPAPGFDQAFIHPPSGNYVMKYSVGQAVLMSPFFFVGHAIASVSPRFPADGFSFPYQAALGMGMFLYALLGLSVLRRILLYYFTDSAVAITLLVLVIGTNYLNYSSIDQAMTHSSLFTIYTLIILLSIRFYERPKLVTALGIGSLCGLAALVRPTEAIAVLLPLFWGISTKEALRGRYMFVLQHFRLYMAAGLAMLAIGFIQPLYWKLVANEWLIYSYQNQGFSWLRPHIISYPFSYRCGWLLYCPMMMLPFVGFIPFVRKGLNVVPILAFAMLTLYIVTAWDVWDYGGTAGRAMVQCYPVLAFPLAALIEWANRKRWVWIVLLPILLLFTYLNIWWLHNSHRGKVPISNQTKEYYWRVVGRWSIQEEDLKLLDNKHSFNGMPRNAQVLYTNDFESDSVGIVQNGINNRSLYLNKETQYSPIYFLPALPQGTRWLRVSADFLTSDKEREVWGMAQFIVKFHHADKEIQTNMIRVHRFLKATEVRNLYFDAKVPEQAFEKISISLWNSGSDKPLLIDNMSVTVFED